MRVSVDDSIERLHAQRAGMRCSEVVRLLEELGFIVKSLKSDGHKLAKHSSISGFYFNFTCGHGRNPQPKARYLDIIRRELESRRDELINWEASK
jgi:hypothetical protein